MAIKTAHYNENRSILADVIPLSTPYTVQIEASQRCNLRCNYCIQALPTDKFRGLMPFHTFTETLDQIKDFPQKLKQINFSGWGEPLMNPDLPDMIEELKTCNIAENIAIVTNGTLLTPAKSLDLISSDVDHIRISLQGMTSARYKEVCLKTVDFSNLIDNIDFLYANKQDCQISVKLADMALDPEEEKLFYETFGPIADRVYIECIRPIFPQSTQDGRWISKFGNDHPPVIVCPQPFFMLSVTANGDIFPCCAYQDPADLGNVCKSSLEEAWKSSELRRFRKMLLNGTRKRQGKYSACRQCNIPDVVTMPKDELDSRANELKERI